MVIGRVVRGERVIDESVGPLMRMDLLRGHVGAVAQEISDRVLLPFVIR